MKKLMSILLLASLFTFVGCGEKSTEEKAKDAAEQMKGDAEKAAGDAKDAASGALEGLKK